MKNLLTVSAIILSTFVFTGTASASARAHFSVNTHGTSSVVPLTTIKNLCGDYDGCTIRMGMYNWDGTGRIASRETLFYYNNAKRTWRASRSDKAGTNNNNVTEHVMNAWTCYFTDGKYRTFANAGDFTGDFALLAWKTYPRSSCRITIID